MTGDEFARAYHEAYTRAVDPRQPRWGGLQVDIRRNRAAAYQQMLDDGWRLLPPPSRLGQTQDHVEPE